MLSPLLSPASEESTHHRRAGCRHAGLSTCYIERIVDAWAPFVVAMNSVNRAMGRPDLYPFVIAPAVVEKLRFIHDLVRGAAMGESAVGAADKRAAAQVFNEAVEI